MLRFIAHGTTVRRIAIKPASDTPPPHRSAQCAGRLLLIFLKRCRLAEIGVAAAIAKTVRWFCKNPDMAGSEFSFRGMGARIGLGQPESPWFYGALHGDFVAVRLSG